MLCEMCGQETYKVKKIDVEGSILSVCSNCTKFGKELKPEPSQPRSGTPSRTSSYGTGGTGSGSTSVEDRLAQRQRRMTSKNIFSEGGSRELIEDYHKVIQKARMKLGMNQEELARKLNERKSIINKLETKSIRPDNKLIRKLEKELKIELMENVD